MSRSLGALVAIVLALSATPALAVAPTPTRDGGPGLMHDVFVVNGYYNDHPGRRDEFGGLWLKRGDPEKLVVMVTDDPPARPYAWEQEIGNPDQLRFRSVEFSLAYLRSIQTKVTHAAERTEKGWAKRICAVGVDVKRNVVTITSYTGWAPVGFWDRFAGVFPRRAIDFQKGCPIEGVDAT